MLYLLKFTQYFLHTRERADRNIIKLEWIDYVINNPVKEEIQSDGRIKLWAFIEEESKFLRVILLEDRLTVHNAFFDRRFKNES
jgi:hypothetical protein